MKAIVTIQNADGTYDEVGMNNRSLRSDLKSERGIIKWAKGFARGKTCRVEIWFGSDFYNKKADQVFYVTGEQEKVVAKGYYYTWKHNIEGCLQNGSFVRRTPAGILIQFMNGDNMGSIDKVPDGMVEVSERAALDLLPRCCGGKS